MTNHDFKTLRDKLNGSIAHSDDEMELQEQWNELHRRAEEDALNDDENWEVCGGFN